MRPRDAVIRALLNVLVSGIFILLLGAWAIVSLIHVRDLVVGLWGAS